VEPPGGVLGARRLQPRPLLEEPVRPDRREDRIAAEVLRMQDVVGSDLPLRVAPELLRLLEGLLGLVRVAGPEQADAAVELNERALRVLLAEPLERRHAPVRPVRERRHDRGPDGAGRGLRQGGLSGLGMELRRVVARLGGDADARARRGESDRRDGQGKLETLGQGRFSKVAGMPPGATIVFEAMATFRELLQQTKAEIEEVDAREAQDLEGATWIDVRRRD